MYVEFGNDKAIEGYRDPQSDDPDLVRYRPVDGERVTQVLIPEGTGLQEAFTTVVTSFGYHIADGEKPTWIESDSPGLQTLLLEHYGISSSANNRKKTWGKDTGADQMPRAADLPKVQATMLALAFHVLAFLAKFEMFAMFNAMVLGAMVALDLRTNAGTDFQALVMSGASGATGAAAPANYIGLTANASAAVATDTTLTGEIGSGTLIRVVATYAHTTGTNTYTLTKTFTSDQSVTIAKIGVFNASTAGTMVFETLLNATATLVSGDQLQVTETVTM